MNLFYFYQYPPVLDFLTESYFLGLKANKIAAHNFLRSPAPKNPHSHIMIPLVGWVTCMAIAYLIIVIRFGS